MSASMSIGSSRSEMLNPDRQLPDTLEDGRQWPLCWTHWQLETALRALLALDMQELVDAGATTGTMRRG